MEERLLMHPYWTPFFYLKFGLAIGGGVFLGVTESIWWGLAMFVGSIIGVTIVAEAFHRALRMMAPATVAQWDLQDAISVLGLSKADRIEGILDDLDFEEDAKPKKNTTEIRIDD